MIRRSAFLLATLLCGCETGEPLPPFDFTGPFARPAPFEVPWTGMVVGTPDFKNAKFETTAEVELRKTQEGESDVIATLPEGTPLVPAGVAGAECMCTRVITPAGNGWVYNRYIAMRSFAEAE